MYIDIEIEKTVEDSLGFKAEELTERVIDACLAYEKCPYEVQIQVIFTDNAGIRRLNGQYRNIDRETDVLSFPMLEYHTPGDFSFLDDEKINDCFDLDTGELLLGDIVISVEKAKEQAEAYGHSVEREIGFLTAHSMFHLFGYDHMEEEESRIMEEKQNAVLSSLGINR